LERMMMLFVTVGINTAEVSTDENERHNRG
jgi:hypothetical protein